MAEIKWPTVKPTGRLTMLKEFPPDERWKMTSNAWRSTYFAFSKLIADAVSLEKATELAGKLWSNIASQEQVARIPERLGAGQNDIAKISQTIQYEGMVEGYDLDVVEESENSLVIRLSACPWWQDLQKRWPDLGTEYFSEVLCKCGCLDWLAELCQIINPKIEVRRATWALKGDSSCDYIFELKK